jgi:hypothetical protein
MGEHLAFELFTVGRFGLWHSIGFLLGFAFLPVHQSGVTSVRLLATTALSERVRLSIALVESKDEPSGAVLEIFGLCAMMVSV